MSYSPRDRSSPLEATFHPLQQTRDHRFGEVLLLSRPGPSNQLIMAKLKTSQNSADCQRDAYQATERMKLAHPHLLQMLDYSLKPIEGGFLVTGFYEYSQHDLGTEILKRQSQRRYFTATELLQLEEQMLEVLTYLRGFKMIHGDVRPKDLAFDAGDGLGHKLVDRLGDASPGYMMN